MTWLSPRSNSHTPDADATPPPWLEAFVVRDVTDEVAYGNARLALTGPPQYTVGTNVCSSRGGRT